MLLLKYYFSVLFLSEILLLSEHGLYKILVEMILIPDTKIPREEQIANVLTHGV